MRKVVSYTIRVSRALGGTRNVKIYGCCMLKSREKGVVLERVAAGKTKEKKKKKKEYKIVKGHWA